MSARERILARLAEARAARGGAEPPGQHPPEHARGPAPAMGPDLIGRFCEYARRLGSEVVSVESEAAVPAAVARYLSDQGLEPRAVVWPELQDVPWRAAGLRVEARAAKGDDHVGITGTFAAIAETGTLMLLSGAGTPATVSLLPEIHVAVVRSRQIVATMEEAWDCARRRTFMPRAVNFVSGPSRTADVEQTITLGAHGPRRVLIVLARA